MTTTATSGQVGTATIEEEFLAIIASDAEIVRGEFEAIIAAEWPDPPPTEPGGADAVGRPLQGQGRRRAARTGRLLRRPRSPGVDGARRERSPPPRRS
ncbi:hypothetical protein [Jatrophihabitans sp.]|uniref:hypothetical protein n=1 Tax=Jatrophihabitans sp. TaxID=1932789 RepID=UPI0030C6A229